MLVEEFNEFFKALCFLAVEPGGTDQLLEVRLRERTDTVNGKVAGIPKSGNPKLGVLPSGTLNEDGADDDLKRTISRPPVLGSIVREELKRQAANEGSRRRAMSGH